jgi:hypothetical protein
MKFQTREEPQVIKRLNLCKLSLFHSPPNIPKFSPFVTILGGLYTYFLIIYNLPHIIETFACYSPEGHRNDVSKAALPGTARHMVPKKDFHAWEKKSTPISRIRGKGFGFFDRVATRINRNP